MPPVVALLTDFGLHDHYVGTMKAVILGICPEAALVDITHDIPPQDVQAAALELAACYRFFPPKTVFLVVVDPGVGSARKPIAVAGGDWRFVAPDNGVLAAVCAELPPSQIVELREPGYALPSISRTFEGRDRFAPAAAWLARGTDLPALGPALDRLEDLAMPIAAEGPSSIDGEVVRVDRFGNLISNIARASLLRLSGGVPERAHVVIEGRDVGAPVATYSEARPGAPCALVGSADRLEIAVNGGSAARLLGLGRGARVRVSLTSA